MATTTTDRALQDWATHWSSHDMEALLSIFTDDCIYEDVTLGVVNHGKAELLPSPTASLPRFRIFMWKSAPTAMPVTGQEWNGACLAHTREI